MRLQAPIPASSGPASATRLHHLRRSASVLALATGLIGLEGLMSPAAADCILASPGVYQCSGATQNSQIINGDDLTATTVPGFSVDTSANGNGVSFSMVGAGQLSYIDLNASPLTGAAVQFKINGPSALDAGSLVVFSDGAITAHGGPNGGSGLLLENEGGGNATAVWTGSIINTGGAGVRAQAETTSGNLSLTVADVFGQGDGVIIEHFGGGSLAFVAQGAITGDTNSGLRIIGGPAPGAFDVEVGEVTGGEWGARIENYGTSSTRFVFSGTVTGLTEAGISVLAGPTTTDIDVSANQVNGQTHGILVQNLGSGATSIVATGTVAAATQFGIRGFNQVTATDLSITAADVFAGEGIVASNDGTGSTQIVATGPVVGFLGSGVYVSNQSNTHDLLVDVGDVTGAQHGVDASNFGDGFTTVRSSGRIVTQTMHGVNVRTGTDSTGVVIDVAEVQAGGAGVFAENHGVGSTVLTATGQITADLSGAVYVLNDVSTTGILIDVAGVQGGTHATSRGILARNEGSGQTFIRASGPASGTLAGIEVTDGVATTDLTIQATDVAGDITGVAVSHFGSGHTVVQLTGTVTGDGGRGIDIATGTGSQGVVVEAVDVFGAFTGIQVAHEGSAGVSVTATGVVAAGELAGIEVEGGDGTTDIAVQAATVLGGEIGIRTDNDGTGSTFVGATGPVTGSIVGVSAVNQAGSGGMTLELSDVTGGTGVGAVNFGAGLTEVRSDGLVTGAAANGVNVRTGTASTGAIVEVVDVRAEQDGIVIDNQGFGASVIAATGDISATAGSGIMVINGLGTTEIQIDVTGVAGGDRGIWATSQGDGGVYVNAAGPVTGTDFGILAGIGANGANVFVNAADVLSAGNGIIAENEGDGFTFITSTGTVVGSQETAIRASAGVDTFNVVIDANNASGGLSGISAVSFGLGPVEITTRGVVEGGVQGIEAYSENREVTIVNEGTVRNASGLAPDRAISAVGESVGIYNNNLLVGEVAVLADASLLLNTGAWQTAGGTSTFAGGDDSFFNQAGAVVLAGMSAGGAETTNWSGLELFMNFGRLQMMDGGAGDTLDTSADVVFGDASELTVDIGAAGMVDRFRTTGAVEIVEGSALTVNMAQLPVLNGQHVVVEAAGGVTGEFVFEDQMLTAFAGLRDGYTATTAFVEFAQLRDLVDAAITPNQTETAAAADSLPDGNALKDALILLPDDATAIDAFDQLSGEIHPSARTAAVEASRMPRDAVLDRLGEKTRGSSAWARVYGSTGQSDGDYNAARMDRDLQGFVVGADHAVGDALTIGFAASTSKTDIDIDRRNSEGTVETVEGLAYVGARFGDWRVAGGVGYAETSMETRREIAFPGVAAAATADYDGSLLQGFVEAGYRFAASGGHAEPFANLTAIQVRTEAFGEQGGGAAGLAGEEARDDALVSTLGLRFQTNPTGALSLGGSAGWRHAWGDVDPAGRHAFAGGAPFTVLGAARSDDAAFARVEARWRLSPAMSIGLAYDGTLGTGGEDHAITGGFKVVF
ncbi:MAG: autotransporter domain-containing protein [Brevundimonas sp.]|uniref:autotransporter domain-containing protein n=1 Tax=Brevundimonas sp. TaxID=1871086 RepID=UPI00391B762E